MYQCWEQEGEKHTTEIKEIVTEGEAVTVCLTVTGLGVGGVCMESVKTCEKDGVDTVGDDGGEEVGSPRKVLDDSCGPAIEDIEGEGLGGKSTERDDVCGEIGLLTSCEILVVTSAGLLLVDC